MISLGTKLKHVATDNLHRHLGLFVHPLGLISTQYFRSAVSSCCSLFQAPSYIVKLALAFEAVDCVFAEVTAKFAEHERASVSDRRVFLHEGLQPRGLRIFRVSCGVALYVGIKSHPVKAHCQLV